MAHMGEIMDGKYKVWMTQGQGCGERPDAERDTLNEALDIAASMFGEGSVGIELPDGSWHEFSPEWDVRAKITLLRMKRDGFNPKQSWVMGKWQKRLRSRQIEVFQHGAHTFHGVFDILAECFGLRRMDAEDLFFQALTWGLFDVFECPTGMMPTDEQIDWLVEKKG